jgi:hypothetical protein
MAAKALMDHDAKNKAAAAQNSQIYQQKLGIKRQLKIRQAHSRQAIADADRSREDIRDAKAHGSIKTELDALVAEASIKASGLAQGQSTDGLLAQAKNTVLQGEAKFLRDMDKKVDQLNHTSIGRVEYKADIGLLHNRLNDKEDKIKTIRVEKPLK